MPKYYTPSEANEMLTVVRPMVGELMDIAERIRVHQPELWEMAEKAAGNGGSATLSKLLPDFDQFHKLMHRLNDLGVEIKDVTIGLIDFRALRDGREVYLCWKYDEGNIQFWHEIEAGFQGRQPIETF
ncbi:MAG: DUF2203 domain-containing protein [Anaerolineales bacterium]|jgi:hypothetical protein|nr:MAG: DUF2203 domain-containing protein [Anaerolineales bacterium]